MRVLIGHSRRKALTGQIRGYLGNLSPFRVKCYFEPAIPYPLGTPATMRGRAEEAGSQMGQQYQAAGYLLQILRRVASAKEIKYTATFTSNRITRMFPKLKI